MEKKLKQRVVGAVLLTVTAVIILPMLLDGSAKDRAHIIQSIPEAPKISLKSLTVQEVKDSMAAMAAASAAKLPVEVEVEKSSLAEIVESTQVNDDSGSEKSKANVIPEKIKGYRLDDNNLPISWSLQLGSFRQQGNATKFRQALRDANYRSYIIKAMADQNTVYRVFVGPVLKIEKLKSFAVEIESKFKVKGQIVRFRIEDDGNQLGG